MLFVIGLLSLVAVARLVVWQSKPETRYFTLALGAIAGSYLVVIPLDGVDLLWAVFVHLFLLVVAMWLLGLVYLRQLRIRRWTPYWDAYSGATLVASGLLLAGGGLMPTTGAASLGSDWRSVALTIAFYVYGVCSAMLGLWAAAVALRVRGVKRKGALIALWVGLDVSIAYVVVVLVLLVRAPGVLSTSHDDLFVAMLIPALIGLALAGLVGLLWGPHGEES